MAFSSVPPLQGSRTIGRTSFAGARLLNPAVRPAASVARTRRSASERVFALAEDGSNYLRINAPPRESRLYANEKVQQELIKWRPVPSQCKPGRPAFKKVYIVRKGPSNWNEEGRVQGSSDLPVLTERGQEVAVSLGDHLKDIRFDQVFCSPLSRSKQTAEIVLARNKHLQIPDSGHLNFDGERFGGFPIKFLSELEELGLGKWEGYSKAEIDEMYPGEFDKWINDPLSVQIDGRNPVESLWEQAAQAWETILDHEGEAFLVVGHNAVNKALIGRALGLGTSFYRQLNQSYGAVNVLSFQPSGLIVLEELNDTAHLETRELQAKLEICAAKLREAQERALPPPPPPEKAKPKDLPPMISYSPPPRYL
eukprot:tig00000140_g8461.t1